jgi:hypothetical protein
MRPILLLTIFACVLHANPQQPAKLPPPAKDPAPPAPPAVPKAPAFYPSPVKIEGDALHCEVLSTQQVPQNVSRTVIKEGKPVTETVTVMTVVYVLTRRVVPLKDVQGYLVNPKAGDPTKVLQKVDPTKLLEHIGKSPKPLVAAGRTPTPAELKDVKESSLLLVVPGAAPAPRDPKVPAPAPPIRK